MRLLPWLLHWCGDVDLGTVKPEVPNIPAVRWDPREQNAEAAAVTLDISFVSVFLIPGKLGFCV